MQRPTRPPEPIIRQPSPRTLSFAPIALLAALALMLAPSLSQARAHLSSSCAPRQSARSCASAKRKSRGKHHHAKHPAAKPKRAHKAPKPSLQPALCENEAAPVAASGSFSCLDGSEPTCEDGATPVLSAHRSALLCPATDEDSSASDECEAEASCPNDSEDPGDEEGGCANCQQPPSEGEPEG